MELDDFSAYRAEKRRDAPSAASTPSPVAAELTILDAVTTDHLNGRAPWSAVEQAFDAVLAHPQNTWSREVLAYRQRILHYS